MRKSKNINDLSEERRLFGSSENDPRSPLYKGKEPDERTSGEIFVDRYPLMFTEDKEWWAQKLDEHFNNNKKENL